MKSAFSGYIPEIPFIFVDNFENRHKEAYFLSHFHGDHVFGLNAPQFPHELKKNNSYIYGSVVTVAIVMNELPNLTPYLKVLELGRNTINIKENDNEIYLNVIALPAGHSLGSIMLLFQYKETILYTGDFRLSNNTVTTYTHLHINKTPIHIDSMYVDTTFQNVKSFPKRSEVVRNVAEYVRDWLNLNLEHTVVLKTSACYGYECVCNEIYSLTDIKTFIGGDKWKVCCQFPKLLFGITNDATSRIRLCTKRENVHTDSQTILTVYFSAMKWSDKINEVNFINIKKNNEIEACFATHCDRSELIFFINYLKPSRITGFPLPYNKTRSPVKLIKYESTDPSEFSRRSKRKKSNSESENSEVGRKITNNVVKNLFDW